jgi:hypothetical protein
MKATHARERKEPGNGRSWPGEPGLLRKRVREKGKGKGKRWSKRRQESGRSGRNGSREIFKHSLRYIEYQGKGGYIKSYLLFRRRNLP